MQRPHTTIYLASSYARYIVVYTYIKVTSIYLASSYARYIVVYTYIKVTSSYCYTPSGLMLL